MAVALGFTDISGAGANSGDQTGDAAAAGITSYTSWNNNIPPTWWGWNGAMNTPTGPWTTGNSIPSVETLQAMLDHPSGRVVPLLNIMYYGQGMNREDRAYTYDSSAVDATGIAAGKIRFNSTNPSLVTEVYIHNTSAEYRNSAAAGSPVNYVAKSGHFSQWNVGDTLVVTLGDRLSSGARNANIYRTASQNSNKSVQGSFYFTISSITSIGDYKKVVVTGADSSTYNRPSTMFTNGARVWVGLGVSSVADDVWSNDAIAPPDGSDGTFDEYFEELGSRIATVDDTVLIRPFMEPNLGGFGTWPGQPTRVYTHIVSANGAKVKGFFHYNMNNTVESFKRFWIRFYQKVTSTSGGHAKFIYCASCGGTSKVNTARNMFPGNAYVDYYGIDVYNQNPLTSSATFANIALPMYNMMKGLGSKPILVPEFGIPAYTLSSTANVTTVAEDDLLLVTLKGVDDDFNLYDGSVSQITSDPVVLNSPDVDTSAMDSKALFRNAWLDGAFKFMINNPRIVGAQYFNFDASVNGRDYRLTSSPRIGTKWKKYASGTYFRGSFG